jgi:hypothetical protein
MTLPSMSVLYARSFKLEKGLSDGIENQPAPSMAPAKASKWAWS